MSRGLQKRHNGRPSSLRRVSRAKTLTQLRKTTRLGKAPAWLVKKPRVEIIGHLRGLDHGNRLFSHGEMCVDCILHGAGGPIPREVEMRHLCQRMNARVGASRAEQCHLLPGKRGNGILQCGLHGMVRRLPLPAKIGATIIFDVDAKTRHGQSPPKPGA